NVGGGFSSRDSSSRDRYGCRGRAGGDGTANVGGGFSSTSATRARARRAKGPSASLGLDPISSAAIPGIGAADLAHSIAKAIGPAIQGAFESVLGGKGIAPAIDTSDTRVTGAEKDRGEDRRRTRSSILLADALGKITPTTANAKNVVNTSAEADKAATQVRLAAKKRRGRRASILANISEEEAQLTSIRRPGASALTFGG
ncbi:hypothetical protein LCGC14_3152250, partial [marine sediment metagenome]